MIHDQRVLAIIAARGGSKGLPGKNIKDVGGQPLIAWSIQAGHNSSYIDRVVLTTDDAAIVTVAQEFGCDVPFLRPAALADDTAKVEDALLHTMDNLGEEYDYLVLLQPTSPLRTAADIDGAIKTCIDKAAPACVSVCSPDKSPYWMCLADEKGRLHRLLETDGPAYRRQDLAPVLALNGAVYVAEVSWFRTHQTFFTEETVGYEMPRERSVDIDTPLDLMLVETILAEARKEATPTPQGTEPS